ncbi:MAG: 3-isopropylmalate dehydrogenase [Herpetosiphon sp.]
MTQATYSIAVLAGDGVGPEVAAQAIKVLHRVGERYDYRFETGEALIGGCAIDATGTALPPETLALCHASSAVLLGAVGGPRWDDPGARVRPEQGLLGLRKALGLFANLRPVTMHPRLLHASPLKPDRLAGVDLLVVRELTGGLYFGDKGRHGSGQAESAFDTCVYTVPEIERVVRFACEAARGRRKKLTSIDKANVLETSRLWRTTTDRVVRAEYADLTFDTMLVDSAAMQLVRRPSDFDVIVTENMFGDILTDEASMLAGSMGLLPSASLGEPQAGHATRMGIYEPIHGSAPDIAGRGIANPIGAILSIAMLLRYSLALSAAADAVEAAVRRTIDDGIVTTDIAAPGQRSYSTAEVGAAVVAAL